MQKPITFKTDVSISTLLILVVAMLLIQTDVKLKPSLGIAVYTLLTLLFLILKKDRVFTIFFVPVILMCSSFFWFTISEKTQELLFPFKQVPGHFVMDLRFIYCIPIALFLGAATTFLYFVKSARHKKAELYILAGYLIVTVGIICYKQL